MADAMTVRRTALDWLSDIVEWGNRLDKHLAGVNWESFLNSPLLQDATSKCAEAVGEAAGQLLEIDPDLDNTYPDLQLRLAYMSQQAQSWVLHHRHGDPLGDGFRGHSANCCRRSESHPRQWW
jgi:hypothetical protein